MCGSDLEASVEELKEDVIARKCRVNVTDIEGLALLLSNITKSLADLKGGYRERERAVTRLAEIIKNGLEEKRERGVQGKKKRERGRDTRLAEIIKNGIEEKERGVTRLAEIM